MCRREGGREGEGEGGLSQRAEISGKGREGRERGGEG